MKRREFLRDLAVIGTGCALPAAACDGARPTLRAGAAALDITPQRWPVPIGSGFGRTFTDKVLDPLHARALVLDDGATKLAIVIADATLISREIFDAVKRIAAAKTGIKPDAMLMAATHTHSAPAAMELALITPDEHYPAQLTQQLAEAVIAAHARLEPAEIGWGTAEEPGEVFCRRWKMRPGTIPPDPFGGVTDRVKMNPSARPGDLLEPAGPVDPRISVIALRRPGGGPIALWATYGLHYVGGIPGGVLSADYFGEFARQAAAKLGGDASFVGMLANGASGDVNNHDYRSPRPRREAGERMREVAGVVADHAAKIYASIRWQGAVKLAATTREVELSHRLPTAEEIEKAKAMVEALGPRIVGNVPGVYARETVLMGAADFPKTAKVLLQAMRIGEAGVATIPGEPFAEIGLNVRRGSGLEPTFTVGLANGYHGYIPTREQHALGGYETWRCRWSCLEIGASEKIERELSAMLTALKRLA